MATGRQTKHSPLELSKGNTTLARQLATVHKRCRPHRDKIIPITESFHALAAAIDSSAELVFAAVRTKSQGGPMAATLPLGTPDRSDCFACCHLVGRRSFANPAKEKQKKVESRVR
ncbi:hypothetical protein HPB50_004702 [Hyalomma asiaticum]|uniref:Uncharacterized protein n=1 Tax=Hyalomma asiaticum TaxID=266040 RepID=A0ACB7SRU1_HYAAI|nr:hypothetical protein HPB50_004702 [Hyalomma asiaticum]